MYSSSGVMGLAHCGALITVGAIVTVAALLLTLCAYNLWLHPLAPVPGPKWAAVSNIWLAYYARNGRLAELGRTLHQQYGEAVRVGPNEVWFNSKAAFKAIYSAGSGYEKSDFYLATVLTRPHIDWRLRAHPVDTLDLLSERDMRRYRLQRRLIGPVYRPAQVIRHEKQVDKVTEMAIKKLRSLDGAQVDLKEWMHMIVVECLGAVVLSWSPGMLDQGTDGGTGAHSYRSWRRKGVFGLFPLVAKLEMCSGNVGRAFSLLWRVNFRTPPNFRPFFPDVGRRIGRRLKIARQGKKDDRNDLAADLIRLHHDKVEFTETYLRKMIMTNFGAGHETMASTLTSIMAMVGSHPGVQQTLADDVQHMGKQPSYSRVGEAPYLQAVIKESKRLHPVIAAALPRRVPGAGLHLHGVRIPASTTVGCSPVALHRNEDICGPQPHAFEPSRWLDSERAKDMEFFSLAWGGGGRTCPGRHLAEMMVWKVLVALFREFEVEVEIPEEKHMPAYFLSMMTGVKARFVLRDISSGTKGHKPSFQ